MRLMAATLIAAPALTACDDDPAGNGNDDNHGGESTSKFVFATSVQGSNGTANVLVTGDSLDEGTISTSGRGLKNDGATQWVFYKDYLYSLSYQQGNDGKVCSFNLGSDGEMHQRDQVLSVSRFSSYGTYNDYIITTSTGVSSNKQLANEKGYLPQTLLITYLNVKDDTSKKNDTASGDYSTENYLGNGEYVTLAGVEQSGSRIYCGAVPMGLSQYGTTIDGGKWIRPGFERLIHAESGGTGAGSYNADELSGTQYPDSCWVAIYDNADMLNPTIARTGRISYAAGRFRSQYYQTVWADDKGDIYVFSSSYAQTMTDTLQQTKLPAGVCRIPAGASDFDDYYCNIQEQTPDGNRSFMRCWPAGGSYFLMVMYDVPLAGAKNPSATTLAIFNAESRKLTYVTGMPEGVSSIGKNVLVNNGKVYIPVNVTDELPAIYGIDPVTARATKGVTVSATEINGFGIMTTID